MNRLDSSVGPDRHVDRDSASSDVEREKELEELFLEIPFPLATLDSDLIPCMTNVPFRLVLAELGGEEGTPFPELVADTARSLLDPIFEADQPSRENLAIEFRDGHWRPIRVRRWSGCRFAWLVSMPRLELSQLRHELAGPLTTVAGLAELLAMRSDPSPDEIAETAKQITSHCARMMQLLSEIKAGDRS